MRATITIVYTKEVNFKDAECLLEWEEEKDYNALWEFFGLGWEEPKSLDLSIGR